MSTMTDEIETEDPEKEGEDVQRPDKTNIQTFFRDYRHIWKPCGAISAGLFQIIYGGQQMGWIINLRLPSDFIDESEQEVIENIGNIWFLYGILGSFVSLFAALTIRKRWIILCASGLNLISAILLTNAKLDLEFIYVSRILGGIAFGLVYTISIKHAADVAHPRTRGFIVGLIHFCITVGVLVNALTFLNNEPLLVSGICGVIFTALGMFTNFLLTVESPIDLIKKKQNDEALKALAYLRSSSDDNSDIQEAFEEFRKMIDEDSKENWWNFVSKSNFFPILPAFLLKVSFVFSYNYTFNCLIMPDDFHTVNVSIVVVCIRMSGIVIGLFTIDMSRIRHFYGISLTGLMALVLSGLAYFSSPELYSSVAPILSVIFLVLSGISLGVLPDVYASEIFSNTKKPVTLFFLVFVELGSQYLIFAINNELNLSMGAKAFHYGITGLMLIGIGIKLFLLAPETAKLTLRESKNMFRRKEIDIQQPKNISV